MTFELCLLNCFWSIFILIINRPSFTVKGVRPSLFEPNGLFFRDVER